MHLNNLSLHNFKKYRRAEIQFQDGLTGIVGSNGTGKSTIVEALAWALYGNRASTLKRELIKNSRAGAYEPVEVRLSLNIGPRELNIYRSMKGKNLLPEARLAIDGHQVATGTKEVDQQLENILRISFQDFMKTFYARQKDLDNLLREGGTGKREYLLKLLGLDDIRERSLLKIKEDLRDVQDRCQRLEGAISEIGDADQKMSELAVQMEAAKSDLSRAKAEEVRLASELEFRRRDLEEQNQRQSLKNLITSRLQVLEASVLEKGGVAKREQHRMEEIGRSRRLLDEMEPQLRRLAEVRTMLAEMEPRRRSYEELSRRKIETAARMESADRLLQDQQRKLASLKQDQSALDGLFPLESEYQSLVHSLAGLEERRDRHNQLALQLSRQSARWQEAQRNVSRLDALIEELKEAQDRLSKLSFRLERLEPLRRELEEQSLLRERQKDLEALRTRRESVVVRQKRLLLQKASLEEELAGLGGLESREADLLQKDRDLDRLGSTLAEQQSHLRGKLNLCRARLVDSQVNLKGVRELGEESNCPTCERPLKEQYGLLVKKYEAQATFARESIAGLEAGLEEVRSRLDDASELRSGLRADFDRLNALKARRAELLAGLRGFKEQLEEVEVELGELLERVASLGQFTYDSVYHSSLQRELEDLQPLVAEHSVLLEKARTLPHREQERKDLIQTFQDAEETVSRLKAEMQSLDYQEPDYLACRKRILELSPIHDRHTYLEKRVQEIPVLERAAAVQRDELEGLKASCRKLILEMESLGFAPQEHDGLSQEVESLAPAEIRAQQIRLLMAGEDECRHRLDEALEILDGLNKEIADQSEKLQSLAYNPDQHQTIRLLAAEAGAAVDEARSLSSDRQVRLGVLQGDADRLRRDMARRKEYHRQLTLLGQRMQVVESTRSLVNRFMDQVLIRIRDDIATSAGRILDEVTGKYSLLKIDDDFNIMVEDGGEYYPITRYSGGEIDMIAVSVRVAISEYLMRFGQDQGSYSFMILDEIFGSQDIEHRERMINMLRRLEDRFPQIFAISHISDVQGQFDNTITVIEDEMGNSTVELS